MKIYRKLIAQRALAPMVPALTRLDAALLRLNHGGSSRAGLTTLREASGANPRKILNALAHVTVNDAIEAQRTRMLKHHELLSPEGPFDHGVTVSATCAISKAPRQAALLAAIVKEFAPRNAVELGTNVGISSAYIASSMLGRLVTLDASAARLTLAKQMHTALGLTNVDYVPGLFQDTLDGVLDGSPCVDFAFIDGHHEYQPTLDYFDRIAAKSRPGAVFVFDDINWSAGMHKAWSELQADARFGLIVDFWSVGLGILREDDAPRVLTAPITRY